MIYVISVEIFSPVGNNVFYRVEVNMKPFQNIPFTLHFSALAVLIAAIALFVQPVQADPVLRGYWTFDSDTVESGVITESSGYLPGVHNGTLINNTSVVDEQTVNGISFNPIAGESGNHLSSGNYISFTNDSYAVIDHTGTLVQSDCQSTFDFGGGVRFPPGLKGCQTMSGNHL